MVPSDLRVFVLSSDKKFVGGPIKTLLTVGSTLKNGDAFPKVPSTWIAGASNVSALNVYFSVPLLDIPITFALDLKIPVVVELSNAIVGAPADPSANRADV